MVKDNAAMASHYGKWQCSHDKSLRQIALQQWKIISVAGNEECI